MPREARDGDTAAARTGEVKEPELDSSRTKDRETQDLKRGHGVGDSLGL